MTSHPGKCCADYQKSRWQTCTGCRAQSQVMPALGLCKPCATGEASSQTEVWKIHSPTCRKVKK